MSLFFDQKPKTKEKLLLQFATNKTCKILIIQKQCGSTKIQSMYEKRKKTQKSNFFFFQIDDSVSFIILRQTGNKCYRHADFYSFCIV